MKNKGGGKHLETLLKDIREENPYEAKVSKIENYFSKKNKSKTKNFSKNEISELEISKLKNKLENELEKLKNKLDNSKITDDHYKEKEKKLNTIKETIEKTIEKTIDKTDDKTDDDKIIKFIDRMYGEDSDKIIDDFYNNSDNQKKHILFEYFKRIESYEKKIELYHTLKNKTDIYNKVKNQTDVGFGIPDNFMRYHNDGIKKIETNLDIQTMGDQLRTHQNKILKKRNERYAEKLNPVQSGGKRSRKIKKSKKHRKSRKIKKRMTRKKRDIKKRRKKSRTK